MEVLGNGGYKHRKEYARNESLKKQTDPAYLEEINNKLDALQEKVQLLEDDNKRIRRNFKLFRKSIDEKQEDGKTGDRELVAFRNDIKQLKKFRDWVQNQFDRYYKEFDERILYALEKNREFQMEQKWNTEQQK